MEPKILGYENPSRFRNKRVKIFKQKDSLDIEILEPEMSFSDLMNLRTKHSATKKDIYHGLRSRGYDFANLGVSGIFTITLDGNDYILTAEQKRQDIGDFAAKLISGYVDARELADPYFAIRRELAEEVLPVTPDSQIIRFSDDKGNLEKTFSEHFSDFKRSIRLTEPAKYKPRNLERSLIKINGRPINETSGVYFQVPSNSAQLVFSKHLDARFIDFHRGKVSLSHTEDRLNKEKTRLEKIYYPSGILLIRLENDDLTDQVGHYFEGSFQSINPMKVNLSEAFAPKEEGIVETRNITLLDYLKLLR